MKIITYFFKICFPALMVVFLSNAANFSQKKATNLKSEYGLAKATNLGKPINTLSGEYAPTVSADGKMLIFESDREERWKWKLYITHKTSTGWSEPILMDNVNSDGWDGAPFLTYDQNYLIISSDRESGEGDIDIWMSQRLGDEWSLPVNIGPPVNSSSYDGFASLSSDGKTLYFMHDANSNEECEFTYHYDIYCSVKQDIGWGEPQKLPYPINSEYCESVPIILVDGKTLIFSSNRPGGFGGYDLYKSEKQVDGSWSEPVNLGGFINTPEDDELVSIPASGDIMYYASGVKNAPDIYSVSIPIEVQQSKVITISGTVMEGNKNNKPLSARITIIGVEKSGDTTIIKSNEVDGKYIAILNKGEVYDVSVSAEGYTFYSSQFDLRELETYEEITRDILLQPIEAGSKIILNNVYFDFNSDSLLDESKYELQRVTDLMKNNPSMIVEIAGHTDSIASDKYNLDLSLRRAKSVVKYLVDNGVDVKTLNPKGYGESQPLTINDTEEGRKQNRRVEFRIISFVK